MTRSSVKCKERKNLKEKLHPNNLLVLGFLRIPHMEISKGFFSTLLDMFPRFPGSIFVLITFPQHQVFYSSPFLVDLAVSYLSDNPVLFSFNLFRFR
jgi:hypothetical protein